MPADHTLDDLVEEVLGNFQGYTLSPDQVTALNGAITATDTTVPIVSVETGLGTGMVEVGDELMYVQSVDTDAGSLTLLPKGRGWRGTPATAHEAGDTVVVSPLVPRYRVKKALNDAIAGMWPVVFGVATNEFTYDSGTLAWSLPAEAEMILAVRYKDLNGDWRDAHSWEVVNSVNTADFATGSALRITSAIPSGATVQVVYGKRPSTLDAPTATLSSSGLSASAKDAVVYGAMARLAPALDTGRLGVQYVPADELDQPRQLGSAMALAREFQNIFTAAVQREQSALQNRYPARIHRVARV